MGRVEKEFLGCGREDDMGVGHIDRDIPTLRRLVAERRHQLRRLVEGLRKQQPAPSAIHLGRLAGDIGVGRVEPAPGIVRPLALEAMGNRFRRGKANGPLFGCGLGHHQIPCVCIHISSSPTCHSSEPRSGVM